MNDPELPSPVSPGELTAQVAALQRQMSTLLLVLLVVSLTLATYLWYEDHIYHKDVEIMKPNATQIINLYNAATAGISNKAVSNFVAQIVLYGQKNPEFAQQVLKKYGINVTPTPPAAPKK